MHFHIILHEEFSIRVDLRRIGECGVIAVVRKKIFKAVYGLPPYEYFQKHRMQKAMQLLMTGNYAIKDVGYTLGYANLSNFTLAFKKEFNKLPSDIIRKPTK